jgi:hypothetical protein
MDLKYIANQINTESVNVPTSGSDCVCGDIDTVYKEYVFAYPDDASDLYRNDKTSFFVDLFKDTDTKQFTLFKGSEEIALSSSMYGTYYNTNSFANFPKRCGYLIDWLKVYNLHGAGDYYYTVTYDYLGTEISYKSRVFELAEFDIYKADDTIKIESYHNGKIEGGIDYSGMNWYKSYRFFGSIIGEKYNLEIDNYQNQNRDLIQIQDKVIINHTVNYKFLDKDQLQEVVLDQSLADKVIISSYEVNAFKEINRVESYPIEFQDTLFFKNHNKGYIQIEYTNKKQNIIKRKYI